MITTFIKNLVVLAVIFSMVSLTVRAANDVQISASTNFSLVTSDTAAAAVVVVNNGGQATNLEIQNNYIDITLENLSNITFNAITAGQYLKITKLSGSNDYAVNPTCVTTSAILTGSGAPVILRLEVITSDSCTVIQPPTPPSGGGGGGVYIPPPANISVKINNGALQASSSAVTLTLGANNAISVLVSNYSNLSGSNWEPYTPTKYWILLPGAGNRSVYVKFRGSGGETPGTFSATINVATTATSLESPPETQPAESATSTACSAYLTKNIALSIINDADEVKKLQTFLRDFEGFSSLEVTGIYDTATFNATKVFQSRYAEDILAPWGFVSPTGMVNVTTIKKINSLYCEKNNPPTSTTTTPPAAETGAGNGTEICSANFTRDLKLGMIGDDVKELQKYLNNNNYLIATSGVGSKGQETNYFGNLTEIALARFQKDNNILGALGIFDIATRNFLSCVVPAVPAAYDINLANRLKGRILLQVEELGEAFYIYPNDLKKYYLGTPDDAFRVMRALGLGANNKFITSYTVYPARVAGKILINVDDLGKAYYISPLNRRAYYLGSPDQAYQVIRSLGLGITNANINKIADGILSK